MTTAISTTNATGYTPRPLPSIPRHLRRALAPLVLALDEGELADVSKDAILMCARASIRRVVQADRRRRATKRPTTRAAARSR